MQLDKNACARAIIGDRPLTPLPDSGWRYRPANVALAKYWGKRDAAINLPVASSLSISMGQLGANTRIAPADIDSLIIDDTPESADSAAAKRVFSWLDPFRSPACPAFAVETVNTVPMAAGLASSASGYAALTAAVDALFSLKLSLREQSILARLGSGSACRSHSPGFVHWHRGQRPDGADSWGEPVPSDWTDLRLAVITVSAEKKAVGSREGMAHTIATSPLYPQWPDLAEADANAIRQTILDQDFNTLGALAEANALAMHATMIAARPSLCYWLPQSLYAIQQTQSLRNAGTPVYLTMDAGPNVKLLFPKSHTPTIQSTFPNANLINPFQ